MSLRLGLALLLMVAMSQLLQQVDAKKKLCGDALNDALDMLCAHGFPPRLRRDTDPSPRSPEQALLRKWRLVALRQQLDQLDDDDLDDVDDVDNVDDVPAVIDEGSERRLHRQRRRIINDCCESGCTYETLSEYCA
ncbi:hypothetical protein KR093_006641 [Drosophila rubida]|uniref:Insulin-like domain-containing protein n=1 Tax=Drosophila rubida TaxID=30044 RepID=A0AAD4K0A6_9MUSC|nr:hypothetical protein KR093_006641 [Drosophila rubida]